MTYSQQMFLSGQSTKYTVTFGGASLGARACHLMLKMYFISIVS